MKKIGADAVGAGALAGGIAGLGLNLDLDKLGPASGLFKFLAGDAYGSWATAYGGQGTALTAIAAGVQASGLPVSLYNAIKAWRGLDLERAGASKLMAYGGQAAVTAAAAAFALASIACAARCKPDSCDQNQPTPPPAGLPDPTGFGSASDWIE